MTVVSIVLFLVLILLITFAVRHWLISLFKAFQPHERLSFFNFPNRVLKLRYFVEFSLAGISHCLWGILLTFFFFLSKNEGI